MPNRQNRQVPTIRQARRSTSVFQEISSRCISDRKLNELLQSKFPTGNYGVDVDQGVYKIRAPYLVKQVEIIKREGVYAW